MHIGSYCRRLIVGNRHIRIHPYESSAQGAGMRHRCGILNVHWIASQCEGETVATRGMGTFRSGRNIVLFQADTERHDPAPDIAGFRFRIGVLDALEPIGHRRAGLRQLW
jgi:hypothetical protein